MSIDPPPTPDAPPAPRYYLARIADPRYPLAIIDSATSTAVARYYATSEQSARRHCERLNGDGKPCVDVLPPPQDSGLSRDEAIRRARELGCASVGDGWRRLLWRMADLLESDE